MRCNMIADFFSALHLIFKHKQKDRREAVFLFPSRRQCINQNPYRGKPWGR